MSTNIDTRCAEALAAIAALVNARTDEALDAIRRDFAQVRRANGLRPYLIDGNRTLRLPVKFQCPECGGRVFVEIDEWSTHDGTPTAGGYRVACEPDTDAELAAWNRDEDHIDGHRYWQSDWQHLVTRVGRWMVRNVRVAL